MGNGMRRHVLFGIIIVTAVAMISTVTKVYAQTTATASEYDVFAKTLEFTDSQNALYKYLSSEACELLSKRESSIASIQTLEGWQARQKLIAEVLNRDLGPFPPKTPLNAKVVRTIKKEGFRIEHVIYESMPNYYVTASLFVPTNLKKKSKLPAILYCSGHAAEGYRSETYQEEILNLVHKGFVVFAFDPIGQGERIQYLDKDGKPFIGGPTREHAYPGSQMFISGNSLAKYMVWDGIRAVDYLLSRKEVDASRIGITGRSGGGTQTAFIAASDERIYAAAPECYLTNFTRLLQTLGPQDAEQNIRRFIADGLDHPDFLIVRAPKPALMITTTNDIFNIQGAKDTEKEVAKVYQAYGKPEAFGRVEDYGAHEVTKKNREAKYAFFQKVLRNPGDSAFVNYPLLTADEMRVTETGQVYTSVGGETLFSLNNKEVEGKLKRLEEARHDLQGFIPKAVAAAKELSGYREPTFSEPVYMGKILKNGYTVEKYFINGEGCVFPYLLYRPQAATNKYMIYLNAAGKSDSAAIRDEIEPFMEKGFVVIAPDFPGYGEMGPGTLKGDSYMKGASHNLWYSTVLIGRSLVAVRAADVVLLTKAVLSMNRQAQITGFAKGEMAPILLHAAAFSKDFGRVILSEPCTSYSAIVQNRLYVSRLVMNAVSGALDGYDLPDLAASLAPCELWIAGATDGAGTTKDGQQIAKDLDIVRAGYGFSKASEKLHFVPDNDSF